MEGQMSMDDFAEKYCKNCKYSYERSEFDLQLHWKFAYSLRCTLIESERDNYNQIYDNCDKWEVQDDTGKI